MAGKNNPQSASDAVANLELALWQAKGIAQLISVSDGDQIAAIQGAAFAVVELMASAESDLGKIASGHKAVTLVREQQLGAAA